jgi:hypothetical protein
MSVMMKIELPEHSLIVEEGDAYHIRIYDDSGEEARLADEFVVDAIEEMYEIVRNFLESDLGI